MDSERVSEPDIGAGLTYVYIGFANSKDAFDWNRSLEPNVRVVLLNDLWRWLDNVNAARATKQQPPGIWHEWQEIHSRKDIGVLDTWDHTPSGNESQDKHLAWLRAQSPGKPIWMQEAWPDIPAAVKFPLDELSAKFEQAAPGCFRRYFTSSIGMMLAQFICQGRDAADHFRPIAPDYVSRIELYGIDLAGDTEYVYQRPNAEWFCGFASGLGIDVWCHPDSAMFRGAYVYAYEEPPETAGPLNLEHYNKLKAELSKQMATKQSEAAQIQATINTLHGALQQIDMDTKMLQVSKRGVRSTNIVMAAAK